MAKKKTDNAKRDTIRLKQVDIKSTPVYKRTSVLKSGGEVPSSKIDSMRKANPKLSQAIGPAKKNRQNKDWYGDDQSDMIRAGLKRKGR